MEASEISKQNDLKARYKSLGKKLKKNQDDTIKEVQNQLENGIKSISIPIFLPKDLNDYLLNLKREINLPASVLPISLFKRPKFIGKEKFFHRLASELISFGIAYQRVYLLPINSNKLATLFHKHRSWWQCSNQDIKKALDILDKNKIVQNTSEGFFFEPLTVSTDVQEFLAFIAKGINEYGEISESSIQQLVPWGTKKIETILELLSSNQICILDRKKGRLFFPELRKEK